SRFGSCRLAARRLEPGSRGGIGREEAQQHPADLLLAPERGVRMVRREVGASPGKAVAPRVCSVRPTVRPPGDPGAVPWISHPARDCPFDRKAALVRVWLRVDRMHRVAPILATR